MKRETASKLKDAGFPQTGGGMPFHTHNGSGIDDGIVHPVNPLVEEIIDKLPKQNPEDDNMTLTCTWIFSGYWLVGYEAYETWGFVTEDPDLGEALANLYLAMKEKGVI